MKLIIGCLAGLLASSAYADEFTVQSNVSKALITPDGSIVTRAVPVNLPAGTHEITVYGVPELETDYANGIDFPDASGLTLIAGSGTQAIAQEPIYKETAEYKALKSELDAARARLHAHQKLESDQQAVVEAAAVRLTFVKQFASGGSDVLSLEQLNDPNLISNLTDQLGEESVKAITQSQQAKRTMETLRERGIELQQQLERAQQRLDEFTPSPRDELVLTLVVNAARPFNGDIQLRYLADAYWSMISDVSLTQDKAKGSLTIAQKAIVQQDTDEDWNDVDVTLSTVDLERASGVNLPRAWIRKLYDPSKGKLKRAITTSERYSNDQLETLAEPMVAGIEEAAPSRIGNTRITAGQTQVFNIKAPLDIQSGDNLVVVPLQDIQMDVDLYARATKGYQSGFLYADITNETGGRILPSAASLYRDGQYFGEFAMPEIVAGDEYPLQLGVLDGLRVDYSILNREDGDRGLLSSSQIAQSRFKTEITSLLDYEFPVKYFDRLPVSESEDLVVKEYATPAISERDIDGRRGVVSWNWDMAAGASQTIEFGYDLSWPSGFAVE